MDRAGYSIQSDGKIDLKCGESELVGIFPYVNGMPIVPKLVEPAQDSVRYHTKDGDITLSLRLEEGGIVLSTELEGFDGLHDIEPVGEAVLRGADHVYVQGFGMEGPSGYYLIDKEKRDSHGIMALCNENETLVVFAKDHRRFRTVLSAKERELLFTKSTIVSVGMNLEGTASGTVSLPDLYFQVGSDTADCLFAAAGQIAEEMGARSCMPPAFHWCSWYYYYENFSQSLLEELLSGIGKEQTGFRYIQVDAGYTPHMGDWLVTNQRYPEGLARAAATIREAGFEAGIWIAPFLVGDLSRLYQEHPDWIVRDLEGKPYVVFRSYTEPKIFANTDSDYYILDVTHPEAFSYLREVFKTLRGYGFTLYKTDFILWGMVDSSKAQRYDSSLTSVEILRKALSMIREEIGEDSFLLGSIAPFMPFIGYADGMRIAGDNGAQWSDKYGPVNLLQELPFDNYFNHVFWQNDPDSMILRDFGTHLTKEETQSLILLQALSGGVVTTSDPVMELPKNRKKWLQLIRPQGKVRPEIPFLTQGAEELVLLHRLENWNLLFAINPTDHPIKVYLRMDELFGEGDWYRYRYNWKEQGELVSEQRNELYEVLMPHTSILEFVTEKPMTERPSNLWG